MKLLVALAALALIGARSARAQSLVDVSAAASMGSGVGSAAVSGANVQQIRGTITRALQRSSGGSASGGIGGSNGSWKEASLSAAGGSKGSWQSGGHGSGNAGEAKGWATAKSGGGTASGWVTNDGRGMTHR